MVQQRLLEIAIREFGTKGLEGASTRGIAAAAGTAMSSITYHYGGKEGLYIAAADYISAQLADLDSGLTVAPGSMTEDPIVARATIHEIMSRMVDKLASERSASWSLLIVREQMDPTEAFDRLYAGPMGRVMEMLVQLVCVATGVGDDAAARITVLTLFGQALVMRTSRAACLRLLHCDTIDAAVADQFRVRIAANIDAVLDRLISERQELQ